MSADEYTPTILMALARHGLGADVLAAHDAEVARAAKAEALEEAAMWADDDWGEFAYIGADGLITYGTVPEMLDRRAAEYRKVATDE